MQLILYPPEDHSKLYYVGRPKAKLAYEYPGNFTRDRATLDMKAYVFGSSVNVDQPDGRRHPLYAAARPVRAVINPGEVLYLPAFWHHEVQSIPGEPQQGLAEKQGVGAAAAALPTGLNVAVNFWFANITAPPAGM